MTSLNIFSPNTMHERGRYPYKLLVKYPHLSPDDRITWERFIRLHPDAYLSVDYDFALAPIHEITDKAAELGIAGTERVWKYRCDVVGYTASEIHLIEVKNRATPKTIGQLVQDYHLFMRDEKPEKNVETFIICREATPEMDYLCAKEDIYLIIV